MDAYALRKKVEGELVYWLPLVRGEICSTDLYVLTSVMPYALKVAPLTSKTIEKVRQTIKENPVFERPEVKEEFDYYFEKLGIIENNKKD